MQIARKLSPSCKAQPAKPKVSSESRTRLERPEESRRRVLRASECRVISERSPRELQDNPSNIQKHVFGLVHRLESRLVHRVSSLVSCDSRATCSQNSKENQRENPSKIHPGRAPGTPKIDPSTLPEHPGTKKNHMGPQSWPKSHESRPKVGESQPKVVPRSSPLEPAGVQNRPKISSGTEKRALRTPRDALFATFGVRVRPESRFSSMFDHFLEVPTLKK